MVYLAIDTNGLVQQWISILEYYVLKRIVKNETLINTKNDLYQVEND